VHLWGRYLDTLAVGVARDMLMSLRMFSRDARGWSLGGLDGSTSSNVVYFHNNPDGHISVLYHGVTATNICRTFVVF
jgi:hypothetical protein